MSFLSKEDSTRRTLEGPDTLVNSLVHIPVAGRCEYLNVHSQSIFSSMCIFKALIAHLPTGLTGILSLLELLVTLLVGLVVTPEGEGLGAQGTGDGAVRDLSVLQPGPWPLQPLHVFI